MKTPIMPMWVPAILLALWAGAGAAQEVDCATAVPPQDAKARLDRALQLRSAGRLDAAQAEVDAVLRNAPNHPRALYSLGMIQLDRNELAQASATMQRAVAVKERCGEAAGPLNSNVHNNIGYAQVQLGEYGPAVQSFKSALATPDLPRSSRVKAQSNLGYVYFVTGNFDLAKPALEEAAANNSSSARYTLNLVQRAEAIEKAQGKP
ncbi:MAG: tetratricopeptide repeat protein [Solimonas sp.]